MLYQTQEGSFDIPDGMQDRSVNMLIGMSSGLGFNVIITRDKLEAGEAFDAFVDRQFKDLARQVSKCTLDERTPLKHGSNALGALELVMQFKQNGQVIHQRQAVFLLADKQTVLVATISAAAPFNDQQKAQWQGLYGSFQPRE